MIEIRFHGMGGQGAVMGALILAEAAFSEGMYAQKIPVYGGMRRGGDVTMPQIRYMADKTLEAAEKGRVESMVDWVEFRDLGEVM